MSYRTLDEIKFICMMINNEIQLPDNHVCTRLKSIEKLNNYKESIKNRSKWGMVNKDIIEYAIDILREKILNGENTIAYSAIYKQASLKY